MSNLNYHVNSMTAFARTQQNSDFGQISWEIRSVNQRYLEITPRLPDSFRHLEADIRNLIKQQIARGKLEISLQVDIAQNSQAMQVNQSLLDSLNIAINQVQQSLIEATHVNPLEILQWPGILQKNTQIQDQESMDNIVLNDLKNALKSFSEHRLREGQGLAQIINQRCKTISEHIAQLEKQLPNILETHTQNLKIRIIHLTEGLSDNLVDESSQQRFYQEVAFLAQKMDINEEIERIKIHLDEVMLIITNNPIKQTTQNTGILNPIGRRLDFLMQELNREANTLGSKSVSAYTSQISVELKVLIEQMREQVQNIE
ncbi:YicC family protein [Thiomicrorhabdus hydrogeniphila]